MRKIQQLGAWPNNFNMRGHLPNMGGPAVKPDSAMAPSMGPSPAAEVHCAFNVPFSCDLAGPNTEEIIYARQSAISRWTHPADAPDNVEVYKLPVHAENLDKLRLLCERLEQGALKVVAHVLSAVPKSMNGGVVTTVCLSGPPALVRQARE